MNEEKKQMTELREWWRKCPAKPLAIMVGVALTFMAMNGVYELGVAFGKFLYYIGV
ncbi:MAG: hypothetical protein IJX63_08225 [Lachnospiraceae bacterium]|nr:hypothetical protein [Lachnospiraceae bacterium]